MNNPIKPLLPYVAVLCAVAVVTYAVCKEVKREIDYDYSLDFDHEPRLSSLFNSDNGN